MDPTPLLMNPPTSGNKSTNVRTRSGRPRPVQVASLRALSALDRLSPALTAELAFGMFMSPRRVPRPAHEYEWLERGKAFLVPTDRARYAGGMPLKAWKWGHRGPTVLLVHGWEGRGAQLSAFIEPLLERGRSVVTFDAPGHGDSPGSRSSLFGFRDAVLSVEAALGPFEGVITHSMGGAAAVMAADQRPIAARFALVCPPEDVRDFTADLSRVLGLSEKTRDRLHGRLEDKFGVRLAELRASTLASRRREPVLLVHDEGDTHVPLERSQRIANHWPGARLVVTQGLGHHRILRDPETVARVVGHVTSSRP